MRHRLNRGGDRKLNEAIHTIAVTRARCRPTTRAYIARRRAQGKTTRKIRRCLKRYITHQLYRYLTRTMPTNTNIRTLASTLDKDRSVGTDAAAGDTKAGTGIVLTGRGLVLINDYVIAQAVDLCATDLGDGRTYSADLVGADLEHDIALIQLTRAAGLRIATLGDSDYARR